jgi:hypothetical protein
MRRSLAVMLAFLMTVILGGQPPVDETRALQALIDATPTGGTLRLEARTYHGQDLRISRSMTIRGQGPDKTRWRRDQARPFFRIAGRTSNVAIQEMELDGGGLNAAGIEALGVGHLRLKGLRVGQCGTPNPASLPGDRFGKPVDGVYAKDVDRADVEACTFLANGRDGFIGIPVRHLRFIGNLAKGNGRMGCTSDVDPEGKVGGPLSVTYLSNEVIDCGTGGLHVETGDGLPVAEALFEGNRIKDCGDRDWGYSWGLVIGNRARGIIRNNVIERTGLRSKLEAYRNGIHLDLLGGPVLVEGNTIKDSGRVGIAVTRSPYPVRLLGNTVQGSGAHGIAAYQVEGLLVRDGAVSGANQSGLWFRLCSSVEVSGNRFMDNSKAGPNRFAAVHAERSSGLKITGNDLGGPPQKVGLEMEPAPFGPVVGFEGNLFEGRRSHPRLSTFRTEN